MEQRPGDVEKIGCMSLIVVESLQDAFYQFFFRLLLGVLYKVAVGAVIRQTFVPWLYEKVKILQCESICRCEVHSSFQHIPQLSHVAGPVILFQFIYDGRFNTCDLESHLAVELIDIIVHQLVDILYMVPQRWDLDGDDVETSC